MNNENSIPKDIKKTKTTYKKTMQYLKYNMKKIFQNIIMTYYFDNILIFEKKFDACFKSMHANSNSCNIGKKTKKISKFPHRIF